ncbi:MAG: helical backbone metal receptor [Desulfomonilia bacterium]
MKKLMHAGPSLLMIMVISSLYLIIPSDSYAQDQPPQRVVSLAPNITREIYDLGAEDLLIGVTSYTPDMAGSTKEMVGSPARINIEKTYSLRAQLVLASTDCNSKSDVEALKKLGLRIHVFNGCESFPCMCATFKDLGAMLGRSQQAGEILNKVQVEMGRIQAKIRVQKQLKVFWQLGENPFVSANDATFSGELILRAGCINIFGNAPMHYPRVNAEEVIKRNPDVIVVVNQMDSGSGHSVWDRFDTIKAVNDKRVYEISANLVCQPTPVMYLKGYKAVLALLYPGML